MAKHKPTVVYCTHKVGVYPYASIATHDTKSVRIGIWPGKGKLGFTFALTRQFAKMLARRINQCLEDTK